MSKSQRDKGARGERELAAFMRLAAPDLFGDAERGTGQSRRAGECSDVVADDEHWIECKRQAAPSPRAALRQAIAVCGDKTPVAITRGDRDELGWIVTLTFADWVALLRSRRQLESVIQNVSRGGEP